VQEEIQELPLAGRDFTDLAFVTPGVIPKAEGGQGSALNVNGARASNTNFYLDGFDNRNARGAAAQARPNIDALQEFKMEVSGYSAEYGRMAGAKIRCPSICSTLCRRRSPQVPETAPPAAAAAAASRPPPAAPANRHRSWAPRLQSQPLRGGNYACKLELRLLTICHSKRSSPSGPKHLLAKMFMPDRRPLASLLVKFPG